LKFGIDWNYEVCRLRLGSTDIFTASVAAQQYPGKPVRMIIPAGPGGGVDTIARLVGRSLSRVLGQPMLERVSPLYEHGVRICLMRGADSMFENFSRRLVSDIRSAIA
jgi:hypothetical protein